MNELKLVVENGKLVADSREVADMIGKDHAHLCRDIAGYVEVIRQNTKLDSDGQTPSLGNDAGHTQKMGDRGTGANEHRANRWSCKTIQQAGVYPAENKRSWL